MSPNPDEELRARVEQQAELLAALQAAVEAIQEQLEDWLDGQEAERVLAKTAPTDWIHWDDLKADLARERR